MDSPCSLDSSDLQWFLNPYALHHDQLNANLLVLYLDRSRLISPSTSEF